MWNQHGSPGSYSLVRRTRVAHFGTTVRVAAALCSVTALRAVAALCRLTALRSAMALCGAAVLLDGCAVSSGTSTAAAPTTSDADGSAQTSAGAETLPKYFSVEVGPGRTLRVAGREVKDLEALGAEAKQAFASGEFAGAAVLMQPGFDADLRRDAAGVLADAGFTAIRMAPAPQTDPGPTAEVGVASTAVRLPEPVAESSGAETPAAASVDAPTRPAATVETLGLHLGGGTNDAEVRARILQKLEESFGALETCYGSANPSKLTRSFGVDLYVPAAGGGPEVRAVRTSIEGAEFKECVLTAYTALRFAKQSSGPLVVSYSVRFEPR